MIRYIITAIIGLQTLWSAVRYLCPWLAYDITFFRHISKCLSSIDAFSKMTPVYTVTRRLIERAAELPDKVFIIYANEPFTYEQVNNRANQIARSLHRIGVKPNETVGMLMTNCADWIHAWFGINKAGGIPSFFNHNLCGDSLLHCIKLSECSKLIISDDKYIENAIKGIRKKLDELYVTVYVAAYKPRSDTLRYRPLLEMADSESSEETPEEWTSHVTMSSHFCYIFTSGTTGPPKQAIISHHRAWMAARIFVLAKVTSQDIVYSTLPLYHASAALLGLLGVLETGSTIVIRKKFSATAFWDECRKYHVTVVQYIGEILRYLCNQPERPDDKQHNVRTAIGNGVTAEVWSKFVNRFGENITVAEFYTSTEGNIGYYNVDGIFSRVGQSSPLYNALCGIAFVKYNIETGEPIRDKDGRCIKVDLEEPGLIICKAKKHTPFLGYRGDRNATNKKILTDVFKPGDQYFNSGDIMIRHHDYTVSFFDRIGDTFRWKGENVSTIEVSDILTKAPGIAEVNAYGVTIPGCEGRVGMVVVVLKSSSKVLDCKVFYEHACSSLPQHARPLFVRVQSKIELTGTLKQTKQKLLVEGYDLEKIGDDPLYVLDAKAGTYVPLTRELTNAIHCGSFRF